MDFPLSNTLIKGRDPHIQRPSDGKKLREVHFGQSLKKPKGVDMQAFRGQVESFRLSLKAKRKY